MQGGSGDWSAPLRFSTIPEAPSIVTLTSPSNLEMNVSLRPTFIWQGNDGAESYQFDLSTSPDPNFENGRLLISDELVVTELELPEFINFDYETTYWWRVRGINSGGFGEWSQANGFTTVPIPSPEAVTIQVNDDGSYTVFWAYGNEELEVAFFDVYKGPGPNQLTFWRRVPAEEFQADTEQGSAAMRANIGTLETEYVAVRAVITDEIRSGFSNVVNVSELTKSIPDEWTLVSFPLDSEAIELESTVLFSFSMSDNYRRETVLTPGQGYWARSQDGESFSRRGSGFTNRTISLNKGWNLIGGLVIEYPAEQIIDEAGILGSTPVFGWLDDDYTETEILKPLEGYWIYAEKDGDITLQVNAEIPASNGKSTAFADATRSSNGNSEGSQWHKPLKLQVSGGGVSRSLRLIPDGFTEDSRRWLLPPEGPGSLIDLRTSDGLSAVGSNSQLIELSSSVWPLTVQLSGDEEGDYGWILSGELDGDRVQLNLIAGQPVQLTEPLDQLRLERVPREQMIFETEMMPGYPNPFNPAINLNYRLASAQNVSLLVYDILGRRVATLVNTRQQPGIYTVNFDGRSLSSGVYIVRLHAGSVVQTQRVSLIK